MNYDMFVELVDQMKKSYPAELHPNFNMEGWVRNTLIHPSDIQENDPKQDHQWMVENRVREGNYTLLWLEFKFASYILHYVRPNNDKKWKGSSKNPFFGDTAVYLWAEQVYRGFKGPWPKSKKQKT